MTIETSPTNKNQEYSHPKELRLFREESPLVHCLKEANLEKDIQKGQKDTLWSEESK